MTGSGSARRRREAAEGLRHVLAAVALSLLAVSTTAEAQSARNGSSRIRIAVFDSRIVLDSLPERVTAESQLALEQAKARTMLTAATDSLRAAVDEFARLEQQLTVRQREATTLHLRARELLVEEMVANLDEIILRRLGELQGPLRERVRAAVRDVRVREGYDLVLDLAVEGAIVDADARIDITGAVLQRLRTVPPTGVAPVGRRK